MFRARVYERAKLWRRPLGSERSSTAPSSGVAQASEQPCGSGHSVVWSTLLPQPSAGARGQSQVTFGGGLRDSKGPCDPSVPSAKLGEKCRAAVHYVASSDKRGHCTTQLPAEAS